MEIFFFLLTYGRHTYTESSQTNKNKTKRGRGSELKLDLNVLRAISQLSRRFITAFNYSQLTVWSINY